MLYIIIIILGFSVKKVTKTLVFQNFNGKAYKQATHRNRPLKRKKKYKAFKHRKTV